jgi:hypothetical protein
MSSLTLTLRGVCTPQSRQCNALRASLQSHPESPRVTLSAHPCSYSREQSPKTVAWTRSVSIRLWNLLGKNKKFGWLSVSCWELAEASLARQSYFVVKQRSRIWHLVWWPTQCLCYLSKKILDRGVTQAIEQLLCKCEALSSNPSPTKTDPGWSGVGSFFCVSWLSGSSSVIILWYCF